MVRLRISYDAMTNLLRRCYGVMGTSSTFFTVSIDSSTPQRFNGEDRVELVRKLLWSNTHLGPSRHTLALTHDDITSKAIRLDFFR